MKFITTGNCCFCFGLRTGTLILGWLQLVLAIINIIGNIIIKVNDDGSNASNALYNVNAFWANIIVAVIQMAMALSLLYGIYAGRRNFVLYYVYFQVTIILLEIIILIVLLAMSKVDNVALTIIYNLIYWVIKAYFVVVVYSQYRDMGGNN